MNRGRVSVVETQDRIDADNRELDWRSSRVSEGKLFAVFIIGMIAASAIVFVALTYHSHDEQGGMIWKVPERLISE